MFADRAVYLPGGDALVVADLHIGRGEASDVEFPLGEAEELSTRLRSLIDRYEPREVVFAGDVLHQFSRVSDRVAQSVAGVTDACRAGGARPVMVAGNHDAQLDRTWDGEIHDRRRIERVTDTTPDPSAPTVPAGEYAPRLSYPVVVRHGHVAPPEDEPATVGTYLIGHDHPTVEIEKVRRPCYLFQPDAVADANVVMLPAFNRLPAGVTVNRMSASDFQSPLLTDADAARPLVWDDDDGRVLPFPPLGEFRRLL